MSLATIVKVRNENWHQVFIYLFILSPWSQIVQLVLLWVSSANIVCRSGMAQHNKGGLHKLRAPWGICVELNLKAGLFSFCFFVLQMGEWGAAAVVVVVVGG